MYRKLGDGEPANPLNEMIAQHWKYVESVLIAHGVQGRELSASGHHYRTAFAHGWKHAKEDRGEMIYTLRGEQEAYEFANGIVVTLNIPKNKVKGSWRTATNQQLIAKAEEELAELKRAVNGDGNIRLEARDLGAVAMMIYDNNKE